MKTTILVVAISVFNVGLCRAENHRLSSASDCEEGSLMINAPEVICEGEPFVLSANLSDFDTYNWTINGQEFTGEEIEYSTFMEDEIAVQLIAANAVCTLIAALQMPVHPQPFLAVFPEGHTVCGLGEELEISTVGMVSWYLNGDLVATGNPVVLPESGSYDVVVENECGSSGINVPVQIVEMPEEVVLTYDGEQLIVSPEGSHYVWFYGGLPIEMSESPTFTPTESGEYWVIVYFENSFCHLTSEFVYVPVSVNEHLSQQISLFPNPSKEVVTIHFPFGNWKITFADSKGRIIEQNNGVLGTKFQLDLRKLAAGTYFILMQSENGSAVKRVLVSH